MMRRCDDAFASAYDTRVGVYAVRVATGMPLLVLGIIVGNSVIVIVVGRCTYVVRCIANNSNSNK